MIRRLKLYNNNLIYAINEHIYKILILIKHKHYHYSFNAAEEKAQKPYKKQKYKCEYYCFLFKSKH